MTRKRPRVFFIAALVLVSFVMSEPAFGQEAYFSLFPVPCSQKAKTRSIALGDVNGDGYLDLVCGNDGESTKLYLNQGGRCS